jgi:hypothetical protein
MRCRHFRVNKLQAMIGQRQALEKGGGGGHGVNGRAHIVHEARQGQLAGAQPPANGVFAFHQQHRQACLL